MMRDYKLQILSICLFVLFLGSLIFAFADEPEQNKKTTFKYPNVWDLKEPLKDFEQNFEKKYSKYKNYYQRWEEFKPERDIKDPPEIDYYINLENNGKLPLHVTIYHNDSRDLYIYSEILKNQKTYNNYQNIRLVVKTYLEGIIFYNEILNWATIDGEAAKMPNIPYFDFCFWVLKKFEGTDHFNNDPEGLLISCETMYFLGPELFPEEIQYAEEYIFPYFKMLVESGNYNPRMLKILYLFERKEKYIRLACKVAKQYPVYFSTWGDDYESYKRNIRIAIGLPELEPFVVDLLNSGEINETTQYDALVYLYNIGTIREHLDIIFRILDNQWFGYTRSPERYMDILFKIKDRKIKEYFIKNMKNHYLSAYNQKMKEYIKKFSNEKENNSE